MRKYAMTPKVTKQQTEHMLIKIMMMIAKLCDTQSPLNCTF